MSQGQPPMDEDLLAELIDRYLSGDHSELLIAELADALRADPAATDVFVMMVEQSVMMSEAFGSAAEHARSEQEDETRDLFSILSELEATEVKPVDLTDELARRKEAELERRRRRSAIVEADTPVARVLVIPRVVVWLAGAAAILLLALVLWPVAPTAPGPGTHAENPGPAREVAMLTAQHNAHWADATPATGDALFSGQRLTLTAGFAEITTARGAVAVIEAPATIELLDNDNAIWLRAGKLVGFCETGASKGFIVHTPHMDVKDVGTRFGVDASGEETVAHVFDGEVHAYLPDAPVDAQPVILTTSQSAGASDDGGVVIVVDSKMDRFATLFPEIAHFETSTGQGLGLGDIDPAWTVIEINGQAVEAPLAMRVFVDPPTREFGPVDAEWIGINTGDQEWVENQVLYTIHTQVEIPDEVDLGTASLLLHFHPDDVMVSLLVNGQKMVVPTNHVMNGQRYEIRFSDALVRGTNEIKLEIGDRKPPRDQDNYVGIKASWQLISRQTPFGGHSPAP